MRSVLICLLLLVSCVGGHVIVDLLADYFAKMRASPVPALEFGLLIMLAIGFGIGHLNGFWKSYNRERNIDEIHIC